MTEIDGAPMCFVGASAGTLHLHSAAFTRMVMLDNESLEAREDDPWCFLSRRTWMRHSRADRNRMKRGESPRIERW